MTTKFGSFFRAKRIATGLTLRQFCLTYGFDPGNLSRLERGILPPPESREKLEQYARGLGLTGGTADWYEFFDLAALERGKIPDELLGDEEIMQKLPVIFRTLRGNQVDDAALDTLVEALRKSHRA